MRSTHSIFLTLLCIALAIATLAGEPKKANPNIWVVDIEGAIGPATSDYVLRAFSEAQASNAKLIILKMNTPGGLDKAMRDIIQAILASNIPVASYVGPKGARAASAGTYISYASHIAAMAPATNLGAATPVQIGTPNIPSSKPGNTKPEPAAANPTEKKIVNDAVAYIRGLAVLRNRNADWAESAVREAKSLDAESAIARKVIEVIAEDIPDLIDQLDGRVVEIGGQKTTLVLGELDVYNHQPDWRTDILSILTNPSIVLVLGMIGVYGIILEFYNPGSFIAGVVGVICLLLAGYSLQLLPLNYAGLALLFFGVALMVAEAMIPSFGILGIGGVVAFSIGGLMLFDTEIEIFQVGIPTVAATATIFALLIAVTIRIALRVHKQRINTGINSLIGETGQALEDFEGEGQVRVGAEIWRAVCQTPIKKGENVRVVSVLGLAVHVTKQEGETHA